MMRNISNAGEKRLVMRRIIIFGAVAFLLGILQCSFFARIKPFGAVPNLMLGSLCAITMIDNKKSAAVYGIAGGYFIDALGAVPPSFSPVFFLISVVVIGKISEKMMPRFVSFLIVMIPTVLMGGVFTYINMCVSASGLAPLGVFFKIALPEMLCTYVFCLPVYFIIGLCMYPILLDGKPNR